MKRVLIYPNISVIKNVKDDRYVQFLRKLIMSTGLIRNDIFWYCVIPKFGGRMVKKSKQIKEALNVSNIKFYRKTICNSILVNLVIKSKTEKKLFPKQ